jgi:hypothetical protein
MAGIFRSPAQKVLDAQVHIVYTAYKTQTMQQWTCISVLSRPCTLPPSYLAFLFVAIHDQGLLSALLDVPNQMTKYLHRSPAGCNTYSFIYLLTSVSDLDSLIPDPDPAF